MSKQTQRGVGDNHNEQVITDEQLAEIVHAMQVMLTNGMPPEVIIERVTERYRNRNQDHVIQEATEAFRNFMEKFHKLQQAVSKKEDGLPASNDHLKVYISHPNTGNESRPQSRGVRELKIPDEIFSRESIKLLLENNASNEGSNSSRDHKEQGLDGEELKSNEQLRFLLGHPPLDRKPQTYLQNDRTKTESQSSCCTLQSELQSEEHPYFLIRSVSREELKAAILQQVPPESVATHQPAMQQIDLEPIREATPKRVLDPCNDPAIPQMHQGSEREHYSQESLPMSVPVTVVEYVSTNDSQSDCIAERLVKDETPDTRPETPSQFNRAGKDHLNATPESSIKPRLESRGKSGISAIRSKPPMESPLAGGECPMGVSFPASSPHVPDGGDQIVQASSSRISHTRSTPSSSRSTSSRKRSTVPKRKDNSLSKTLVLSASFLGFAAVGGYVIYKNRFNPLNYN